MSSRSIKSPPDIILTLDVYDEGIELGVEDIDMIFKAIMKVVRIFSELFQSQTVEREKAEKSDCEEEQEEARTWSRARCHLENAKIDCSEGRNHAGDSRVAAKAAERLSKTPGVPRSVISRQHSRLDENELGEMERKCANSKTLMHIAMGACHMPDLQQGIQECYSAGLWKVRPNGARHQRISARLYRLGSAGESASSYGAELLEMYGYPDDQQTLLSTPWSTDSGSKFVRSIRLDDLQPTKPLHTSLRSFSSVAKASLSRMLHEISLDPTLRRQYPGFIEYCATLRSQLMVLVDTYEEGDGYSTAFTANSTASGLTGEQTSSLGPKRRR